MLKFAHMQVFEGLQQLAYRPPIHLSADEFTRLTNSLMGESNTAASVSDTETSRERVVKNGGDWTGSASHTWERGRILSCDAWEQMIRSLLSSVLSF